VDVACGSNANAGHALFIPGIGGCTPRERDTPYGS
jgi:hypothetical protein